MTNKDVGAEVMGGGGGMHIGYVSAMASSSTAHDNLQWSESATRMGVLSFPFLGQL